MARLPLRLVVAMAIAAPACRIQAGIGAGTTPSPASVTARADDKPARADWKSRRIAREELDQLIGLTPQQASQRLLERGHRGPVTTREVHDYYAACQRGRVCGVAKHTTTAIDDPIELLIYNPKLDIPPPP